MVEKMKMMNVVFAVVQVFQTVLVIVLVLLKIVLMFVEVML